MKKNSFLVLIFQDDVNPIKMRAKYSSWKNNIRTKRRDWYGKDRRAGANAVILGRHRSICD
ncbi:hypothetical protein PGB90_008674 [Kerria lacca]